MKITGITTEEYRWPRRVPITNGLHTYNDVEFAFVRIRTDEGIEGIGLGTGGKIWRAAVEHLAPMLIGEDPRNTERLWTRMWVPKLIGRRGLTTRAISSIDIGLWDIKAKAAGMPLYRLLGGFRESVPTYVAGGYYEAGKGLAELAQEMETNVKMGARAIKMKVGALTAKQDAERVRVVREAIGPEVKLLVDANCAYRWYSAVQFARLVEEHDVFWFEEPVQADDYEGHRKLAQQCAIPIATGENEYTRYGFRDLIKTEAVAILNPDAKVMGGITEFMKVVALAQSHDLDIAPHGSQDIHVHLVAAIANGLILEFYGEAVDPMASRIYRNTLSLNPDGTVSPPQAPGIGVDLNYDVLAEFRVA